MKMRYRIKFKNKVENASEKEITIKEEFLKSQLEILIDSGYRVLSARLVEEK
jgi:hypothetical protein